MTNRSTQAAGLLQARELDTLLAALTGEGFELIGPRLRHGVIVLDTLQNASDLPRGCRDEHGPGHYRVKRDGGPARFSFVVSQDSWKRYLFPPEKLLFTSRREGDVLRFTAPPRSPAKRAFIGVRGCDLAAIEVQASVFSAGSHAEPDYAASLAQTFIVAVDCSHPAATCFCTSMGTGPAAGQGFDLALTEVVDDTDHYFVLRTGSTAGRRIADRLPLAPLSEPQLDAAERVRRRATRRIGRELNAASARQLLKDNPEHPRWQQTGERCLSCGSCTMVCPTCFCSRRVDTVNIEGDQAEQRQLWDSCFNRDFSESSGIVRHSIASRYRQWITHKLSSWHDQFDSSGCVGCGRCVTWCPARIDITEELAAVEATGEAAS